MLNARVAVFVSLSLAALVGCESGELVSKSSKRDTDSTMPDDTQEEEKGKGSQSNKAELSDKNVGPAAARRTGVVFLHGTGDQGDVADYACSGTGEAFHCEVKSAIEYWLQPTLDSERTRADGAKRPYAVLGCPLGSQTPWPNAKPVKGTGPEPGSAVCASAEIARFLDGPDAKAGTGDDITDIVLVTHSGGSNVVRYMLQQHAAQPAFGRIHKAARGFIGLAAPTTGTYLADWVFRNGSLPSVLNGVLDLFGKDGVYDDDGTHFIQTSTMAVFNRDPAKLVDTSKDVAGVPSFMGAGTNPSIRGDADKLECGGGKETKGLALLHTLYLSEDDLPTSRDGCSDGFVSCRSAMALANGDASRVIFGRMDDGTVVGKTEFRAHHQSRRQCDGLDLDVRTKINELLDSAAKPTPKAIAERGERTPFQAAEIAAPAGALTATARTTDAAIVVDITLDATAGENLGVRATLVAVDAFGAEVVVASEQSAARANVVSLRLPRNAELAGDHLSVRDVALVRHDDATTVGFVARIDL